MLRLVAQSMAIMIYCPLSRTSNLLGNRGKDVLNCPLHCYVNMPFAILQNDDLDRFGTRLGHWFSKKEIATMLEIAGYGLSVLKFSNIELFGHFLS